MTDETAKSDPTDAPPAASNAGRRRIRRLSIGIIGIFSAFALWQGLTSLVAYTDDGYVASQLIAVAPQVTGVVASLNAENNQDVRKGDLLATIDTAPFMLAVAGRKAALLAATAGYDAGRDEAAAARAALAGADAAALDRVNRRLAVREAAVTEARAALDLAEWQLRQTEIRAPADGTVSNLSVGVGETATAGKPLIGIIAASGWRIVANYKENYVTDMRPGQTAWVWLDTHPWRFYRARVDGVARGVSRSERQGELLPYVAPTTDWIRLKRRFPVTLSLVDPPPGLTLYMGADASALIFR